MPISNSWLNQGVQAILSGIQELELNASGGGGGSASYRYVTSGKIELPLQEMITIIPGTPSLVHREVSIMLISGSVVSLEWRGMGDDCTFLQLTPENPFYKDTSDGGIQLKGYANTDDCEVAVIVRQQEPILYKIQGKYMGNIITSLWLQTDFSYSDHFNWTIAGTINNLTSSDEGLIGHKIFFVSGVEAQTPITFEVDASNANIAGAKIDMELIDIWEFLQFAFTTGVNNFLLNGYVDFITKTDGVSKMFTEKKKIPSAAGGSVIITPKLGFLAGRFTARNPFSNAGDTCVITRYEPNVEEPGQGGTFILGGF